MLVSFFNQKLYFRVDDELNVHGINDLGVRIGEYDQKTSNEPLEVSKIETINNNTVVCRYRIICALFFLCKILWNLVLCHHLFSRAHCVAVPDNFKVKDESGLAMY